MKHNSPGRPALRSDMHLNKGCKWIRNWQVGAGRETLSAPIHQLLTEQQTRSETNKKSSRSEQRAAGLNSWEEEGKDGGVESCTTVQFKKFKKGKETVRRVCCASRPEELRCRRSAGRKRNEMEAQREAV